MTRPNSKPRLPPRARPWALAFALLAAACGASPPTAVANLEDLYKSRDDQLGAYSEEVTDRGWTNTTGLEIRGLFGDPAPITEVEQLSNPIEFGLLNLSIVFDSQGKSFDDFEWARAMAVASEIGRIDPARILRSRGYETAATLWRSRQHESARFEVKPVDEAALEKTLEPLQSLSNSARDLRDTILANRSAELTAAARALSAARPGSFELGLKLLKLAARCGRLLERSKHGDDLPELDRELKLACVTLAGQVAFVSAIPDVPNLKGAFDSSSEARISAGRLLLAVDPTAATIELGKVWKHTLDPLVRVAWLQAITTSGLTGAAVHPSLRGPLLEDLSYESENAAVRFWAKTALATLLRLDVETVTETDLRAKWLALGDWDSGVKRT
jgi:hypothetical protein